MADDHRLNIVLAAKDITGMAFTRVQGRLSALTKSVFSLQGGLLALAGVGGFGALGKSMLDTAASFEKLEIKLDGLTKGRGKETLEELNAWAKDMPVNTRQAVGSFAMMQAMGLNPTIDKMQTLVDVSSVFGQETMPRVARALGQMQTLGKLSAEELNQLAEAGINARRYLTEAFGMTVEELKASQISIEQIVDAIWKGLNADFNGQAKAAMKSWDGLVTQFESNWMELERQVMNAGVFDVLKDGLDDINQRMANFIETNDELIKQNVAEAIDNIGTSISNVVSIYNALPDGVVGAAGAGIVGRILFGSWGAAKVLTVLSLINSGMGELGMGLGDIARQYGQLNDYMGKIGEVLRGERDWNTGEMQGPYASQGGFGGLGIGNPGSYTTKPLGTATGGGGTSDAATNPAVKYVEQSAEKMDAHVKVYEQRMAEFREANRIFMAESDTDDIVPLVDQEELGRLSSGFKTTTDAMAEMAQDSAWSMRYAFAEFFDATSDGFLNLETLGQGVARSLVGAFSDLLAKQVVGGLLGGFFPSAHGNVFSDGHLVPFARGGIVNRPTVFPFASGIGLMGEAGPEAIMPLTRTAGGDLGVRSQGGGGNTIIIHAIDARSFERKLMTDGAGAIERVVTRNLMHNGAMRSMIRGTT